ncbi:MAG: hypothetical protein K9N06_02965 [Candidatus Cloacimonetes bacterium]|nr:hypothetical protein [Candidatus Cloacimonadota bacterium]
MYINDYAVQSACGWGKKLNAVTIINNIVKLQQHPLILGLNGGDLLCVMCEHLPVTMEYKHRIEKMLEFALQEVNENFDGREKYDFILGLPEIQTGKPGSAFDNLDTIIEKEIGEKINKYRKYTGYKNLGYELLKITQDIIREGETENVITGSLDSHLNEEYINYLKREKKVYDESKSEGIVPGEAVVILKLSRDQKKARQKIIFMMQSESLKEIFKALFQDFPDIVIEQVIGNFNTRKKINEYFLASMKFSSHFKKMEMYKTPSGFFGDTGVSEIFIMLLIDYINRSSDSYQTSLILEKSEKMWSFILVEGNKW